MTFSTAKKNLIYFQLFFCLPPTPQRCHAQCQGRPLTPLLCSSFQESCCRARILTCLSYLCIRRHCPNPPPFPPPPPPPLPCSTSTSIQAQLLLLLPSLLVLQHNSDKCRKGQYVTKLDTGYLLWQSSLLWQWVEKKKYKF